MHIRKFDFDYSRRNFMEKTAKGILTAGVLTPLWPLIAHSADITKAYPDELLSIEGYTKGKIKTGDLITADNVELVKNLLDPVAYRQVKEMGRRIRIVASTRDVTRMYPHEYLEATLRNKGKAKLDQDGNVVTTDGKPWIGGNPFPEGTSANEVFANLTLCWGRHDNSVYAVRDWEIGPDGDVSYQYDFVWVEENTVARVGAGGPYLKGLEDKLRFQSVFFTSPADVKGTSYLNTWHYDQRKFPDLVGYLPAFKRVRKFPTNQRFEPLVAGMALYLSDAWAAGDPMLTWGNYKIVGRGPFLGAVSENWYGDHANWERPVHGGPKGQTFFETQMELCPEVIVVEAEPVGYSRAPVSKKRVWIDVRNMMYVAYVTYDRRGEIWKQFEPQYSLYEKGGARVLDGKNTAWSWTGVHCHDIQSNRMTRFVQAKTVAGGVSSGYNQAGLYEKYLTEQAMQRLGT
ncbi:DUF1329 domain-containing protein [Aromatoleum toluolicum]|uniref:DUF1329 domain-containing protein n=1 Tax=Aromatoleum toluolicum TaxID=90060 RepID=A0ABX1NHX1_9RHOO|nr:DUF1329 domain-containing protein [Aromatoleum toluolicum]NMF98856.1 DUF1329 domain-containing protein [Aromatoleum toluolicum]